MENTSRTRLVNYRILLSSDAIDSFALGLFGPFYVVFIQDFGNSFESFGFAIGVRVLAGSVTSYFAGSLSDRIGRKKLLVGTGFAFAAIIFTYTLITSLVELYALQVVAGVVGTASSTTSEAFLGDITEEKSRGKDVGRLYAITGIAAALAIMGGGYTLRWFGVEVIFYSVAALLVISTLILLSIKETR